MDGISLIVRGDDFGLCHASNQAIEEAFETGLLSCATLAVYGPWVAEAVEMVRGHPEWEVGLQLGLHCASAGCRWGPVAGAVVVPSLVENTGTFASSLSESARPEDITRELDAQIERARAWHIEPAYLEFDGAAHPAVEAELLRLSERLGAPARMTNWGIQRLAAAVGGPADVAAVRKALEELTAGVYVWAARPAQDSPETWAFWPDYETAQARHAEALALCDPEIIALIQRRGIELISFRQHLETQLGTELGE